LEAFFAKGRDLVERNLLPLPDQGLIVEFGCGAGRILRHIYEQGRDCAGIDISPTMVDLCRRLVPQAQAHVFAGGRTPLPDGCASLVYSYAVVQHISRLSDYFAAFDEMCRLVAPGGVLRVQVACDDFLGGLETPGRTENFETYSLHSPVTGKPYRRDYNNWIGVAIGHEFQEKILRDHGLIVGGWRAHSGKQRSRAMWVSATRPSGLIST
ncbi:MAG TPA: class I SAM-dependent methyltransferase, partial [Caulobacteraceae bacterium]